MLRAKHTKAHCRLACLRGNALKTATISLIHPSTSVAGDVANECSLQRATRVIDEADISPVCGEDDLAPNEQPRAPARPLQDYPNASLAGLPLDMWNILVKFLLEDNPHVIHHFLHPNKHLVYICASKPPNTTFAESMMRRKGLLGVHRELRDYLQPLFSNNKHICHAYSFRCGLEDLSETMWDACPGTLNSPLQSPLNVEHLAIYLDDPSGEEPVSHNSLRRGRRCEISTYLDTLRKLEITLNSYTRLKQFDFKWSVIKEEKSCPKEYYMGHPFWAEPATRPAKVKYGRVVGWRNEDGQWHVQFFDTRGVYSWLEHRMVGQKPKCTRVAARIKLDKVPVSHYTGAKY